MDFLVLSLLQIVPPVSDEEGDVVVLDVVESWVDVVVLEVEAAVITNKAFRMTITEQIWSRAVPTTTVICNTKYACSSCVICDAKRRCDRRKHPQHKS